jgi:probable F420-dependent oxidoreductase
LVENVRGHVYERPRAAMEAYLDGIAGATMFSAERETQPAVMIAALGPAMLRLASAKAAGALPYLVPPEHTVSARAALGDGAFLAVEQAVTLTQDEEEFHALAAGHLQTYLSLDNYRNNLRRLGFDESDLAGGGSARLHGALVAHGDEGSIWARVDQHFAAGADHVAIQILGADRSAPPLEDWERLSPRTARR